MTTSDESLGVKLTRFMQQLADQIDVTRNSKQRARFVGLHRKASGKLQALIDKIVPETIAEYAKATAALEEANAALRDAHKDIKKVAKAITLAARAIGAIAKLVAVV
jgi:hypothetical protein